MAFNPRELYDASKYREVTDVIRLTAADSTVGLPGYHVAFLKDSKEFKFASIHHVFGCIRNELIRKGTHGYQIKNSARYAISDDRLKIPSLFNPDLGVFIHDPLLPYRNPVIELYQGNTIVLHQLAAKPHYFAPGAIL